MKKAISLLALITSSALFTTFTANAQVSVNVNIGAQPLWGPVGHDYAEYYYLPDIEAYYYVPKRQWIYRKNKNWVFVKTLPAPYASFNLYNGYKVVINDPMPYMHHDVYYKKYYGYRGKSGQPYIRNSHDEKYWVINDHPEHGKWKNNGNGNGVCGDRAQIRVVFSPMPPTVADIPNLTAIWYQGKNLLGTAVAVSAKSIVAQTQPYISYCLTGLLPAPGVSGGNIPPEEKLTLEFSK